MGRKKKNKQRLEGEAPAPRTMDAPTAQALPSATPSALWMPIEKIQFAAVLALSLIVYWYTMWPAVGGGDAGELIAASYTLSVIHPPGYPLFVWLGKILSYMPWGTVAWRIGWVSVLASVGAHAFYFLSLRRLTGNATAAFLTTGVLAFSPLIWRYSIGAEVFTLNNFFIALMLYLFLRFCEAPSVKRACGLAFVFGLGLCNHHTLLFMGLPMAGWILVRYRAILLKPQILLLLVVSGLAGLLPYLHIPWASAKIEMVTWGDETTFQGFMTHFMRKEYGTFQLASDGSQKLQLFYGLFYYFINLAEHALYLGAIPLGFGVWMAIRGPKDERRAQLRLLLGIALGYLVIFHYLANLPYVEGAALYKDIVSRFWVMGHMFFFVFLAVGLAYLMQKAQMESRVAILVASLAITLQVGIHFTEENQRHNWTFDKFGRYLLSPLPPNSLFFTLGDINTNSVRYLQNCEGVRPDVKILDRSLMSYPWYKRTITKHYPDVTLPGIAYHPLFAKAFNFDRVFSANYAKFPIFVTFIKTSGALEASDKSMEGKWRTVPYGLSLRVVPKDSPTDIEQYISESQKFILDPYKEFEEAPPKDSWDSVVKSNYWLANHMRAAEILKYAMDKNFDQKYLKISAELLGDLIQRNPEPPPDYYKNYGIAHHHLARVGPPEEKKTHEQEMIKAWKLFVEKTERRDKLYNEIVSVLKSYGAI